MTETLDQAALFVDPHDAQAWAQAMSTLLVEKPRRDALAVAAQLKASAYTWQETALRLTQVFSHLVTAEHVSSAQKHNPSQI
jgi:glycosyltransferase involved in cell wall biosynthesis